MCLVFRVWYLARHIACHNSPLDQITPNTKHSLKKADFGFLRDRQI